MAERIREKIREIQQSVEKVEEGLPENYSEFKSLDLEKDGIYKNIETAIQASYDICALILKDENLRVPGEEESIAEIVEEEGIIDHEMSKRLKDMKGFRNALAHRYGKINDEEAFQNIQTGLQDFQKFMNQIEKYLNEQ